MPEGGTHIDRPSRAELDIIRSFGWAVVEYEEALYQKFLHLSAGSSLITFDDFRLGLRAMESKGYVSSLILSGERAYRRLLVEDDTEERISPAAPLDEMRLVLGSRKAKRKKRLMRTQEKAPKAKTKRVPRRERPARVRERNPPPLVTRELVNESGIIAEVLKNALAQWVQEKYGFGIKSRMVLRSQVDNMRHALTESEETLFSYIREEVPHFLPYVQQVINSHGSDFLLLSLRLV